MLGNSALAAARPAASSATAGAAGAVLLLIAGGSLLRLLLAASLGLSVDESYTVSIGRQLALSYFDHPPLHVWLAHGWALLAGSEAHGVVRIPFILLFAGSTWLMYRLTASAFGERAGFWAALGLNLAPLFTVGTASWVLPDGPLVFFSLAAVWLLTRILAAPASQRSTLMLWLAAGACCGLALLSKYLAVFPLAGMGLFLVSTRHRRLLVTPGPWLALLVVVLLFTPVLVWNAAHGWASLRFQGGRALPVEWSLARLALGFCGQIAYLLPWTAAGLLIALAQAMRPGPREDIRWLFACLALPPIAFFTLAGLWAQVLPHWPAIGWVFAFPLLGAALAHLEERRPRLPGRLAGGTAAVLAVLLALVASQASWGWMDRVVPSFPGQDPTLEVLDWKGLQSELRARRLMTPDLAVATVSWIEAGKVDYALGGQAVVLCLSGDPRGFAFLRDSRVFAGRTMLIVASGHRADWYERALPYFRRIETLPDVEIRRPAGPALTLKLALGWGLKPGVPGP